MVKAIECIINDQLIWFQIFLKNEMLCVMWFDKIKSSQLTFQKKKKYLH
jgi:hypothetical protein